MPNEGRAGATDDGTPDPTPTPTDTGKPDPTDTPSTPAPDPSTPGGGDTGKPTPPAKDPNGDLAHTGSDTPIGLLSGIAAAVIAAGAGLVWWMRRRKTAQG
ncbi:LAETG motif-containing sortase-dependent surface protein [Streptomyces decoyicus]|uniref:LAETG motif-containing sortase-dependent surface protein n=1 Tax=Streptomyces decoyicus TaxID=249567 RepID=UPI0033A6AA8C